MRSFENVAQTKLDRLIYETEPDRPMCETAKITILNIIKKCISFLFHKVTQISTRETVGKNDLVQIG